MSGEITSYCKNTDNQQDNLRLSPINGEIVHDNQLSVGILTLNPSINYGSNFLSLALQTVLQNMGHHAEIIYYCPPPRKQRLQMLKIARPKNTSISKFIILGIRNVYSITHFIINAPALIKRNTYISNFSAKYHNFSKTKYLDYASIESNPPEYDVYIAGGDQVWNPVVVDDQFDSGYFLAFARADKKRISYSASLGNFNPLGSKEFCKLIRNIDAISVRESHSVPVIKDVCGIDAVSTLDPVLLLSAEEWRQYEQKPKHRVGKFILVYAIGTNKKVIDTAKMIARHYSAKIVYIHTRTKSPLSLQTYVRPEEFLWYFHYAEFIVTNSFHGTVFSIINKKPFYTIQNEITGGNLRALDLLTQLGLEKRLFTPNDEISNIDTHIDYDVVQKLLSEKIQYSMEFLYREVRRKEQ